ncbi:MAG: GntR family transcriptional regulator [Candidatus Acidiferrales bacterium]
MANAPILRVDLASARPVYEQIVSGIRALLVSGAFDAGQQLPTVRQLAVDLGVHHNTVAEAYRVLADEGWLDLRRGRGAVVVERQGPKPTPEARQGFVRRLEELIAKAIADGVPRAAIAGRMAALAKKVEAGGAR